MNRLLVHFCLVLGLVAAGCREVAPSPERPFGVVTLNGTQYLLTEASNSVGSGAYGVRNFYVAGNRSFSIALTINPLPVDQACPSVGEYRVAQVSVFLEEANASFAFGKRRYFGALGQQIKVRQDGDRLRFSFQSLRETDSVHKPVTGSRSELSGYVAADYGQ